MGSYIIQRLLLLVITLFGVTLVSFWIMQQAPGDPLMMQLGSSGTASASGQTREAYLVMKRDLMLNKPVALNFEYFKNFSESARMAALFRGLNQSEIAAQLVKLAAQPNDAALQPEQRFLESLEIPDYQQKLRNPETLDRLAKAVEGFSQSWCENLGEYAVPAEMTVLNDTNNSLALRIGATRALASMVVEPFLYTFPQDATPEQRENVVSTWRIWWGRNKKQFAPLDEETTTALKKQFAELTKLNSRQELFAALDYYDRDQTPFFIDTLFGDGPQAKKEIAAMLLTKYIPDRLAVDAPLDATPEQLDEVAKNWEAYYTAHSAQYHPGFFEKLWCVVADTQYAHMVGRLATFQFGRSVLKSREPVSQKMWDAFVVSAPLMLLAELIIYLVAVPLGILCAVDRGGWWDRITSLVLFLLYSIPPAVAAMLMLLYFCYGDYLKWFPMRGIHSDNADQLSFLPYVFDYLQHAFLPVICLSLFSLASMAMYSRSAMLDVLGQDYIRTARAKGLSSSKVIWKHSLRNSLVPIITLFASFLPAMLGGSVLVESLFDIPGLGRLGWASIEYKDYTTLMALMYVEAIVVMLSILLCDLLYVVADPRISFGGQGEGA